MADSIMLASAHQSDALLWTLNRDFENLPAVRYVAKAGAA